MKCLGYKATDRVEYRVQCFQNLSNLLSQLPNLTKLSMTELSKFRYGWHSYYTFTTLPKSFKALTELEELRLGYKGERLHPYTNYPKITLVKGTKEKKLNLEPIHLAQTAYQQNKEGIAYLFKHGADETKRAIVQDFYNEETATLDLSGILLEQLPKVITEFKIRHLNLSGCRLGSEEVHLGWLGKLTELESLNLENNSLVALPRNLDQISTLRTLNLSWNNFSSFPTVIYKYKNLEQLDIRNGLCSSWTNLQELDGIKALTKLRKMSFTFFNIEKGVYDVLFQQLIPNCKIDFS